jgi:hypothetical protein
MTVPTAEDLFSTWLPKLEEHMWVARHNFITSGRSGAWFEIDGWLKADPKVTGGRAIRRAFADGVDALLDALGSLGAVHTKHPDIRITGRVIHSFDKPDDFAHMQCEIRLSLAARP